MPMLMTTPGLHSKLSVVLTHARNISIYPLVVWGDFAADCHSASKLHYQVQENCMKRADRIIRSKKHLADNLFWMLNPVASYRKNTGCANSGGFIAREWYSHMRLLYCVWEGLDIHCVYRYVLSEMPLLLLLTFSCKYTWTALPATLSHCHVWRVVMEIAFFRFLSIDSYANTKTILNVLV